jgi:ribosomal protein L37E
MFSDLGVYNMGSYKEKSKHKEVSIVLAVFLTFWTWLYTAEKDWWKFVVGLVVGIATAVLNVYLNMPFIWLLALNYAVLIWAIVDVAIKKDEWYRSYFRKQPIRASNGTPVITGEAAFCPRCGNIALDGKDYCWNCGKSTNQDDEFCRRCGISLMDTQSAKFCRHCGRALTDI